MKINICLEGAPSLSQVCNEVKFPLTEETKQRITDLLDTLLANKNAIGVASPQIGYNDCALVYRVFPNTPPIIMINPVIVKHKDEKALAFEMCLSFPRQIYKVNRWTNITVKYQDLDGRINKWKARDFEARVIQHEMDHLIGQNWPKDAVCLSKAETDILLGPEVKPEV
jgi:peptide deformylase